MRAGEDLLTTFSKYQVIIEVEKEGVFPFHAASEV